MISLQEKLIACAVLALGLAGSGWQARTWYDGAQDAARLEAEARATELLGKLAAEVSTKTELAIQNIRIENRTIHTQAEKEVIRETVYSACILPDTGRLLVNQARAGAAAGKPDDRLPSARTFGP
jgi:hypothetical protein